eukprot:133722-Hanusia_phi.AAC.1
MAVGERCCAGNPREKSRKKEGVTEEEEGCWGGGRGSEKKRCDFGGFGIFDSRLQPIIVEILEIFLKRDVLESVPLFRWERKKPMELEDKSVVDF